MALKYNSTSQLYITMYSGGHDVYRYKHPQVKYSEWVTRLDDGPGHPASGGIRLRRIHPCMTWLKRKISTIGPS
jgi:hypothetical protein